MLDKALANEVFGAAMRLHESLDAGRVVAVITKFLPTLVEADSWGVFLKAEHAERLELVRAVNPAVLPLGPFVEMVESNSPLVKALSERRAVVSVSERAGDAAEDWKVGRPQISLSAPLVAGERIIGAIQAIRFPRLDRPEVLEFSPDDLGIIELFCASAARALANSIDYADATRQCLIDDLTRLYNVRYLYQTLDGEIRRARRYNSPVSVVFVDLDGFKRVNDAYGHLAGSVTLTEVAQVIILAVRESDFVARYGGDEFVMMLPETTASRAANMAERVRAEIAAHRFTGGVGAEFSLTASFGVASYPDHGSEAEKLIELADAAMYEAKQSNKNRVCLAAR